MHWVVEQKMYYAGTNIYIIRGDEDVYDTPPFRYGERYFKRRLDSGWVLDHGTLPLCHDDIEY